VLLVRALAVQQRVAPASPTFGTLWYALVTVSLAVGVSKGGSQVNLQWLCRSGWVRYPKGGKVNMKAMKRMNAGDARVRATPMAHASSARRAAQTGRS
jgi:hypothetical protein